jgi:hypothetical protein
MSIKDKIAVVTGGSRGLGLDLDHISSRPRCRAAACDHIGRNLRGPTRV